MAVGKIRADKITTDIGNTLLSERTVDSSPDDAMVTRSYYKSNFVDKITNIENQAAEFSRHIDARLADMQARIDRLKLRLVEVNRLTIEKITGSVERTRQDITTTLTNEVGKARTDITNLNNSTWNGVKDEIARRLDQRPRSLRWRLPNRHADEYPGSAIHRYVKWFNWFHDWSRDNLIFVGTGAVADQEVPLHSNTGCNVYIKITKSGTSYSIYVRVVADGPGYNDGANYYYRDPKHEYGTITIDSRTQKSVRISCDIDTMTLWQADGVNIVDPNTLPSNGIWAYYELTGSDGGHTRSLLRWENSRFNIHVDLPQNRIQVKDGTPYHPIFY